MNNYQYITASGDPIEPEELTCHKAKDLVRYLQLEISPYSRLIECRKEREENIVVFEVDVEIGQRIVHDIKRQERIAITFAQNDNTMPEVVVLRDNFPKVPHINLSKEEYPRSLCLFDRPYEELKARWNAFFIIERIREWLTLTAKGILHEKDQPLEPLLLGFGIPIIIPHNLFAEQQDNITNVDIRSKKNFDGTIFFVVNKLQQQSEVGSDLAITIKCPAQQHGIINYSPQNLEELHRFVSITGYDLIGELRTLFKKWISEREKLNAKITFIVYLPKTRNRNDTIESTDIWAFLTNKTVREIGEDLGIWELTTKVEALNRKDRTTLAWLGEVDTQRVGTETPLVILHPLFTLSRNTAAYFNGINNPQNPKIVAIGAGALGSQVLINSIRAGYGDWTSVDKDYLAPHNLARHELDGEFVGYYKSYVLSKYAETIIDEDNVAKPIIADIINPKDKEEELKKAYSTADVILDMSAALSVSKHLALEVQSDARRISIFLNPSGTDLVILAEDAERKIGLDHLESQYYWEIINRQELSYHLAIGNNDARYGRSCGDVSSRIPHNFISIHSAIASEMLRNIVQDSEAFMGIWKINSQDMTVSCHKITPGLPIVPEISTLYCAEDWVIYTYPQFIARIFALRKSKLPCETGGVLIGSYDFQRKIIYVIDTIASPPDSIEKPTTYIRGSEGLEDRIQAISQKTAGILEYIGEWHSHPNDCDPSPSQYDRQLFEYMKKDMQVNSLPTLMLIAGSQEKLCWLLDVS
ncbi:MAG: Mov34/MPN/PAD-1 family protein [Xenococcus sp. (in: cyanobacteria)]